MKTVQKQPLIAFKFGTGSPQTHTKEWVILPVFLLYRFNKRFKNRLKTCLSLVWPTRTKGMVWASNTTHTKEWVKTPFLGTSTGTVCPYQRPVPYRHIYGLIYNPLYI